VVVSIRTSVAVRASYRYLMTKGNKSWNIDMKVCSRITNHMVSVHTYRIDQKDRLMGCGRMANWRPFVNDLQYNITNYPAK
jgi:hypothetical protein